MDFLPAYVLLNMLTRPAVTSLAIDTNKPGSCDLPQKDLKRLYALLSISFLIHYSI